MYKTVNTKFFQYLHYIIDSKVYQFIEISGLSMLIGGTFISQDKPACANIGMALALICIVLRAVSGKKMTSTFSNYALIAFSFLFIIHLISQFLNHEGWNAIFYYERNKLLWIGFPIVFAYIPFRGKNIELLYAFVFVFTIEVISMCTLYNYLHRDPSLDSGDRVISEIYVPYKFMVHHMLALVANAANIVLIEVFLFNTFSNKKIKYTVTGISFVLILFTILFIHLTGARIGILILYISLIYLIIAHIRTWRLKIMTIAFSIILAFALSFYLYKTNENFNLRMSQTIEEVEYLKNIWIKKEFTHVEHKGNFSARIISFQDQYEVLEANFWTGIGSYFFSEKMEARFDAKYPKDDYIHRQMPPNQWLRYAVGMGIPFALLFLIIFHYPLFLDKNYAKPITALLLLNYYLYCMTEAPMEYMMSFRYGVMCCAFALRLGNTLSKEKIHD